MIVVRGADETVVGNVHQLPKIFHAPLTFHNVVHKFLRADAGLAGFVFNFLAMLVRSGEEHHVKALQALVAGDGVSGHGAVGMADVQLVAGIINRRGDIKLLFFHNCFLSFSPLRMKEGGISFVPQR